jgi:hypothetical protein
VDGQCAAPGHGVNIAGRSHGFGQDIFLEILQGLFFKSHVFVGFFQIAARRDDPVPRLEVQVSHDLVAGAGFAQQRIAPGIDDVEHLARFGGDGAFGHFPDEAAALLVLGVVDVLAFLGDVNGQVALRGHGVEVAGIAHADTFKRFSGLSLLAASRVCRPSARCWS